MSVIHLLTATTSQWRYLVSSLSAQTVPFEILSLIVIFIINLLAYWYIDLSQTHFYITSTIVIDYVPSSPTCIRDLAWQGHWPV